MYGSWSSPSSSTRVKMRNLALPSTSRSSLYKPSLIALIFTREESYIAVLFLGICVIVTLCLTGIPTIRLADIELAVNSCSSGDSSNRNGAFVLYPVSGCSSSVSLVLAVLTFNTAVFGTRGGFSCFIRATPLLAADA